MNRVPGQPLFLVNPNSKFDPTSQLVLNPAAWMEPPFGTFGASAAYFNDFRWQRQPAESMAFGRTFSIKEKTGSRFGRNSRTSSTGCSIPYPAMEQGESRLPRLPATQTRARHCPRASAMWAGYRALGRNRDRGR